MKKPITSDEAMAKVEEEFDRFAKEAAEAGPLELLALCREHGVVFRRESKRSWRSEMMAEPIEAALRRLAKMDRVVSILARRLACGVFGSATDNAVVAIVMAAVEEASDE